MWFETLTGFREKTPQQVRENLSVEGEVLKSHVNGKEYQYGRLDIPTLGDLKVQIQAAKPKLGKISAREVVADVQELHRDPANRNSLFQVASQFNLLEMASPDVTPEQGVEWYEMDRTQGPACAIAAGAGTIYRNYFVEINGQIGQSTDSQIDCLADLGNALGNSNCELWTMQNGYALASREGLEKISDRLKSADEMERETLRKLLRIGIQWNTEVTISDSRHTLSQAYCSALPVAYSPHPPELWEEFAKLILEASYEATFCAGILNYMKTGNKAVYLTLLGGGAFGNAPQRIVEALERSLYLYKDFELDVAIVSHGSSKKEIRNVMNKYSK